VPAICIIPIIGEPVVVSHHQAHNGNAIEQQERTEVTRQISGEEGERLSSEPGWRYYEMSFPRLVPAPIKIEDLLIRKFCGACIFSKRCNGAGQFVIIPIALCCATSLNIVFAQPGPRRRRANLQP